MQRELFEITTVKSGAKAGGQGMGSRRQGVQSRRVRPRISDGYGLRICLLCKKEFEPKTRRSKYCSSKCHITFKNWTNAGAMDRADVTLMKLRPQQLEHECVMCKTKFISTMKQRRYCSPKCYQRAIVEVTKEQSIRKVDKDPLLYIRRRWLGIRNQARKGRRTNRAANQFTLTCEDLIEKWIAQDGKCALTGFPMTHNARLGFCDSNISVDRIDNDGPYSSANTRLVCFTANMIKRRLSDEDLVKWCKAIVQKLCPLGHYNVVPEINRE